MDDDDLHEVAKIMFRDCVVRDGGGEGSIAKNLGQLPYFTLAQSRPPGG